MRSNIDPLLNKKPWLPKVPPKTDSQENDEEALDREFAEQRFLLGQYWNICAINKTSYLHTVAALHDGFVRASSYKMTLEEKRELIEDIKSVNTALEHPEVEDNIKNLIKRSERIQPSKIDTGLKIGALMGALASFLLIAAIVTVAIFCPLLIPPVVLVISLLASELTLIASAACSIAFNIRGNYTLFGQQLKNGEIEKTLAQQLNAAVKADASKEEAPKPEVPRAAAV